MIVEFPSRLSMVLRRARALLEGGWTHRVFANMCETRDRTACWFDAEMVAYFTVEGALQAATRDEQQLIEAWAVLKQVHAPLKFAADELLEVCAVASPNQVRAWLQLERASWAKKESDLDDWLERPHRVLGDVLKLFDLAISRASSWEAA